MNSRTVRSARREGMKHAGGRQILAAKRKAGFTLVELMVVVGMIAVLISILMPALGRMRDQARAVKCATNLRAIGDSLHAYLNAYNRYLPPPKNYSVLLDPADPSKYNSLADPKVYWGTYLARAAKLVPEVFTCPSNQQKDATPGYSDEHVAYGFNGWDSYVSVPHRRALNPGWARLTIKISVRFSSLPPQDYDLIRKGRSRTPGGDYKVEIARSGQALCLFGGSRATAIVIGGPALNDGRWHRISCIRGARSARLIVDGHVRRRVWKSVGSIANTATLFIGARPGTDWHRGRLDEAKIIVG